MGLRFSKTIEATTQEICRYATLNDHLPWWTTLEPADRVRIKCAVEWGAEGGEIEPVHSCYSTKNPQIAIPCAQIIEYEPEPVAIIDTPLAIEKISKTKYGHVICQKCKIPKPPRWVNGEICVMCEKQTSNEAREHKEGVLRDEQEALEIKRQPAPKGDEGLMNFLYNRVSSKYGNVIFNTVTAANLTRYSLTLCTQLLKMLVDADRAEIVGDDDWRLKGER